MTMLSIGALNLKGEWLSSGGAAISCPLMGSPGTPARALEELDTTDLVVELRLAMVVLSVSFA